MMRACGLLLLLLFITIIIYYSLRHLGGFHLNYLPPKQFPLPRLQHHASIQEHHDGSRLRLLISAVVGARHCLAVHHAPTFSTGSASYIAGRLASARCHGTLIIIISYRKFKKCMRADNQKLIILLEWPYDKVA